MGKASAQRALFKQYYGYAKRVCLRYASGSEEADEILNDSFLKVFQRLPQYDSSYPFKTWLRTIVINTAISYHRKYHKLETVTGLDPNLDAAFQENILDQLAAEDILLMVQQLSSSQRTVFSLHVVEGYSLREIGELLTCNEATVRSHYLRARLCLQELVSAARPTSSNSRPVLSKQPRVVFR